MKPIRSNVLVEVDMSQKSDYEIVLPSGLRLWMNSDFGWNEQQTKPNLATVLDPGQNHGLVPGDRIVTHHNCFSKVVNEGYLLGDTGVKNGSKSVFSIDPGMIHFRIEPDGKLMPVGSWMIVEPIAVKEETFLIVPDSVVKVHDNMYKVLEAGDNDMGIENGDVVITYAKSGVPVIIHGETKVTIYRCKHDNVLAVMEREVTHD